MRTTMLLLSFLALTFEYSTSHAQEAVRESTHPDIVKATFSSSPQETNRYDDFGTVLGVNSLIIGLYALYWFKQKA